jgi:hypothetical protein
MKSIQLLLLTFGLPLIAFSQDITGLWAGTLYSDSTRQEYHYEVGITQENGRYVGYSHTWFIIDEKQYFGLKKVKVKIAVDGKVVIEDGDLLLSDYPLEANKNVRQLNVLDFNGDAESVTLNGLFVTNRTKTYVPLTGKVQLTKRRNSIQSNLIARLQQLGKGFEDPFMPQSVEAIVKND